MSGDGLIRLAQRVTTLRFVGTPRSIWASEKAVLVCLAAAREVEGQHAQLSVSEIAARTSLNQRTIGIALRRLVSAGLIERVGKSGRQTATTKLNVVAMAQAALAANGGSVNSRGRKKENIGRELARRVLERDLYRCVSCGTHLDLTCDHIIPESRGGATTFENLQAMCRPCNLAKGARMPGE